jgi:hypothetical protein
LAFTNVDLIVPRPIDTAALASPPMTPQAQALANQYRQQYGAAAKAQLGCGP